MKQALLLIGKIILSLIAVALIAYVGLCFAGQIAQILIFLVIIGFFFGAR